MTITDFILARVAEEETLAHEALDARAVDHPWDSSPDGEHFNRWNPWRVQSACIARRLLVRAHRNTGPVVLRVPGRQTELLAATCLTCHDTDGQPAPWPCYTLRILAAEWAQHPDYRQEWRPQTLRAATRPTVPTSAALNRTDEPLL